MRHSDLVIFNAFHIISTFFRPIVTLKLLAPLLLKKLPACRYAGVISQPGFKVGSGKWWNPKTQYSGVEGKMTHLKITHALMEF